MSKPKRMHWEVVKWILRGTTDTALSFCGKEVQLQGYIDSDLSRNKDKRSMTRYVFTFRDTTVNWISQLQKIVTLSSTVAEYIAEASKEQIWLKNLMKELGRKQENNRLFSDN